MSYHSSGRWSGIPVGKGSRFGRLVREIIAGLDALHRVQFDAPWSDAQAGRRR